MSQAVVLPNPQVLQALSTLAQKRAATPRVWPNNQATRALASAVTSGDARRARRCLAELRPDCDPNAVLSASRRSLLTHALWEGHEGVARALWEAGAKAVGTTGWPSLGAPRSALEHLLSARWADPTREARRQRWVKRMLGRTMELDALSAMGTPSEILRCAQTFVRLSPYPQADAWTRRLSERAQALNDNAAWSWWAHVLTERPPARAFELVPPTTLDHQRWGTMLQGLGSSQLWRADEALGRWAAMAHLEERVVEELCLPVLCASGDGLLPLCLAWTSDRAFSQTWERLAQDRPDVAHRLLERWPDLLETALMNSRSEGPIRWALQQVPAGVDWGGLRFARRASLSLGSPTIPGTLSVLEAALFNPSPRAAVLRRLVDLGAGPDENALVLLASAMTSPGRTRQLEPTFWRWVEQGVPVHEQTWQAIRLSSCRARLKNKWLQQRCLAAPTAPARPRL